MCFVERRPSSLSSTGLPVPLFYKTIQVVPPSRPWSSSVPCVSPGHPERNAGCPLVVCSSSHMISPIPYEFTYVSMISLTLCFFSDPLHCFTVSPRDVYHDSFVSSVHSSEFQGLLFRKIPGFRSIGNCWSNALVINLTFKNDRNVFFSEDRTRSAESLSCKGDMTFDLLFLRGGIHGNALTEIQVMIDSLLSMVVCSFQIYKVHIVLLVVLCQ